MARYVKQLECRFHPDAVLIEDARAGDVICPQCGMVVGERIVDVGSEWRTISDGSETKDRARVGAAENLLFERTDLDTLLTSGTSAGALDEFGKQKYKTGTKQMSSEDRTLQTAYSTIRQMAGLINLPSRIIERAFLIFKACHENKLLKGRSHDGIVSACIYIACRKEGESRSIKEICAISKTASKNEIGRCFKHIIRGLPNMVQQEAVEIKSLIPRFCTDLQLENRYPIQKTAIHIAETAKNICDIQSRAPDSIAAAAIYMACAASGEKRPLSSIQVSAGVAEATIRTVYKLMLPNASQLFPSDFVFKCPITSLPTS